SMRMHPRVLLLAALLAVPVATRVAAGGGLRAELEGPEKDRSYLVHTFMCGKDAPYPVKAWAEGVVNGRRRTVLLTLRQLGRAARSQLDRRGPDAGRGRSRRAPAKPGQPAATTVVAVDSEGRLGEPNYLWQSDGRHECDQRLAVATK